MIGLLTTGSMGLGWLAVIGRSLVPSPPAITTAFTCDPSPSRPSTARPSFHRTPLHGHGRPGRATVLASPGAAPVLDRLVRPPPRRGRRRSADAPAPDRARR